MQLTPLCETICQTYEHGQWTEKRLTDLKNLEQAQALNNHVGMVKPQLINSRDENSLQFNLADHAESCSYEVKREMIFGKDQSRLAYGRGIMFMHQKRQDVIGHHILTTSKAIKSAICKDEALKHTGQTSITSLGNLGTRNFDLDASC